MSVVLRAAFTAALAWSAGAAAADASLVDAERPAMLRGADLSLTFTAVSGVEFAPEAYESQASFVLEPSYLLGKQWFRGGWAEPFTIGARLVVDVELSGNEPQFRGAYYASPALFGELPAGSQTVQTDSAGAATPYGRVEGAGRRLSVSDLWLTAEHERLATIPFVGVDVQGGLRVVLPTSVESRAAGLIIAPSLSLGFEKKVRPATFGYGARLAKYFYAATTAPITPLAGTVDVNGLAVEPWHPESTGDVNPSWAFMHFLAAGVDLPRGISVEATYLLMNTFAYPLTHCEVDGVPTADVCADGAALGDVRRPAERDSSWFLLEASWKFASFASVALGLSTVQPVRQLDGSLAFPFFRVSRDNNTTVFLSVSASAEAVASSVSKK